MMSFPLIQSFFAHDSLFCIIMFLLMCFHIPIFWCFLDFLIFYQRLKKKFLLYFHCLIMFCSCCNLDIIALIDQHDLKVKCHIQRDVCVLCFCYRWCFIQNLAWAFVFIRNNITRINLKKNTFELLSCVHFYTKRSTWFTWNWTSHQNGKQKYF